MKKTVLIICTLFYLVSCGSSQVVKDARKTFKGEWTLNDIVYPDQMGELNVTLFEDATAACLRNSTWNFISNNNTGSYVINNPQCDTDTRFFIWTVNEVDAATGNFDFLLKPTNSNYKSTTGNQGFRVNLVSLTDAEMVWEQTVNFEGEPFTIRINFNKN